MLRAIYFLWYPSFFKRNSTSLGWQSMEPNWLFGLASSSAAATSICCRGLKRGSALGGSGWRMSGKRRASMEREGLLLCIKCLRRHRCSGHHHLGWWNERAQVTDDYEYNQDSSIKVPARKRAFCALSIEQSTLPPRIIDFLTPRLSTRPCLPPEAKTLLMASPLDITMSHD